MAVNHNEAFKLFEQLPESAQQSTVDFMKFLSIQGRPDWDDIARMEPDDLPLSEEEERQLADQGGFITGEDAKREFNLQVDLP
ncbi:XRE family transcriptional regulator [Paenibacillus crassostreae]|uniref:XRE family transcriptional regulator n=1 Tax=Paenibacillus crassostreae TaxID=1763538 RepID=A0A167EJR4_9BACL|nr:XRE family transcriptional regulator [Paenibacillus crassostreae]AOZ94929.1 hypothetical protein LPB68_21965 [Paenibacillus crassostreae]OAB75611.1 XRE family transcriptional regulator [Paenibacillus crassostreae]